MTQRNPSDVHSEPGLRSSGSGSDGSASLYLGANWVEKRKWKEDSKRAEKSRLCPGVHTVGGQWPPHPYIGLFPQQEVPEGDCHPRSIYRSRSEGCGRDTSEVLITLYGELCSSCTMSDEADKYGS